MVEQDLIHNKVSAFLPLLFDSCPLGKFLALKYHHQHQLNPKSQHLRDDRLTSANASKGVEGGASNLEDGQ